MLETSTQRSPASVHDLSQDIKGFLAVASMRFNRLRKAPVEQNPLGDIGPHKGRLDRILDDLEVQGVVGDITSGYCA